MSKATLFDSRIKKYAYCKPPEICRDLGTSALGLSKEQVDTMREKYGKNSFQERKTDTTIQRLRRAFINPFPFKHDGVTYTREYFASNPDNVMVARLTEIGRASCRERV